MSLILPLAVFFVFYFFIIRPKQAKLKAAQQEQMKIAAGDRVLTRAGIYGRVVRILTDLAVVEVAPGIELVFDRRSVSRAPESVDVDSQLSQGDEFSAGFSEEDFSELHNHLESQSSTAVHDPEGPSLDPANTDSVVDGAKPVEKLPDGAGTGEKPVDEVGKEDHGEEGRH